MNNNSIVVIDSSDDEESVFKKIKLDFNETPQNNHLGSIQIGEIKSLVETDIVVIEDEEEQQQPVLILRAEKRKDPFENIKSNSDLIIEKREKNDITFIDINTITNEEDTKIKNVSRRVELTAVITKEEVNENFIENKIENLLEPSTSTSNTEIQENGVSSTSEEKSNEITEEFELFLNVCKNCECQTKYKELIAQKLPKLEDKYNQANEKYIKSKMFKKLLLDNISKIKRKSSDIILYFSEVYKELDGQKKRTLELTEKDCRNLEKLQKVLKKVNKKISQLEVTECNFDEESNSEYLMLDRYKKRATLIYKKICSITNDNPYASRQMYKNLDISCSKYSEINRAIDKLYSKNKQFPSYYDVDQCVRKCAKKNNLVITDSGLTIEINKIFKHVGELLKRRRKLETYESINDLVEPAEENEDPELEKLMDERHIENEKRIDEVLEKYVAYQEEGKNPTISSDSDDSNHESEDSSDE